jgi:hypothetical protein
MAKQKPAQATAPKPAAAKPAPKKKKSDDLMGWSEDQELQIRPEADIDDFKFEIKKVAPAKGKPDEEPADHDEW